jgi:hypothetical protein
MLVCRYIANDRIHMDTFQYRKPNIPGSTFAADVATRSNLYVVEYVGCSLDNIFVYLSTSIGFALDDFQSITFLSQTYC